MTALERVFADAAAAGITQGKIDVGGLGVNVARFGKGKPLLLLHGWPEFWLVWRPVMLRLGDSFELVAPDLRGCGDTGKPTPGPDASATAERHALDMFGVMDALGFERFGVIGGDLGAYVMQAMSHHAPRRHRDRQRRQQTRRPRSFRRARKPRYAGRIRTEQPHQLADGGRARTLRADHVHPSIAAKVV